MCLASPAKVLSIDATTGMVIVALGGIRKEISLTLVDDVRVDDVVLIHVGYVLNGASGDEAGRTLRLFAEAGLTAGEPA